MADQQDFTFMKSGFNNLVEKDETLENTAAVVMAFMQNALRSAAIYVKHSSRKSITPEDIKRALMLEVFFIKQRDNMLEQCEEMKQILKNIIEGEEDDEDDDLEDLIDDDEVEFSESTCNCPMCHCINTIYTRWEGFEPETFIEKAMARHIEAIN